MALLELWTWVVFWTVLLMVTTRGQNNNEIKYSIAEELPTGSSIGSIVQDSQLVSTYTTQVLEQLEFSFHLPSSQYYEHFSISNDGQLTIARTIDRDVICPSQTSCDIYLGVKIQPPQYFQIIRVILTIEDLNDNTPTFPQALMRVSLPENSPQGTSVQIQTAADSDSPINGVQSYQILTNTDMFEIQEVTGGSGEAITEVYLVLLKPLDRELVDYFQVEISANDRSSRGGIMTVEVDVVDTNDHPPLFSNRTYSVSVSENLPRYSQILRVNAEDEDTGDNGEIVYTFDTNTALLYGHLFNINNISGVISLAGHLNFEAEPLYQLGVTAQDKGLNSLSSRVKVIIQVIDVNDHPPQISVNGASEDGVVEVIESAAPGAFVAHITVTDLDSGRNGDFHCVLNSPYFRLQQLLSTEYKILSRVTFDREERWSYTATVTCTDRGTPRLSSTMNIPVSITDINDKSPSFLQEEYTVMINENNDPGQFIIRVQATDSDIGDNAEIRYELSSNVDSIFQIDPVSGNISTLISLDYESRQNITFLATATDLGLSPRSTTASVTVIIKDEDDNAPTFIKNKYTFNIQENLPSMTSVGHVAAVDLDSDEFSDFTYAIKYSAHSEMFTIDSKTGTLLTNSILDRERNQLHEITVLALDHKDQMKTSSCDVVINILDENDNAPAVSFPNNHNNSVHISNRIPVGYAFTRILATDADDKKNAELLFSFSTGNEEKYFHLDKNTGVITSKKSLFHLEKDLFGLVILIQDNGEPQNTAEAILNIIVDQSVEFSGVTSPSDNKSGENHAIIIAIATGSALVSVALIIAIIMVARHPLRRVPKKQELPQVEACFSPKVVNNDAHHSLQKKLRNTDVLNKNWNHFESTDHLNRSGTPSTLERTNAAFMPLEQKITPPICKRTDLYPSSGVQQAVDGHSICSAGSVVSDSGHGSHEEASPPARLSKLRSGVPESVLLRRDLHLGRVDLSPRFPRVLPKVHQSDRNRPYLENFDMPVISASHV